MRFNILSAVTVALSASTTYAQLIEPKAVVDAIDKITDLSNDTADAAEKVQQVDITAIVPAGFVSSTSKPLLLSLRRSDINGCVFRESSRVSKISSAL